MIWGVDLGVRKLALFGLDGASSRSFAFDTTIGDRGAALTTLSKMMTEVLDKDPEAVIFIEEPPKVRNMRTFLQLSQTCGMVLSYARPTYAVPVTAWKKAVVGKGNATKEEVASWLKQEHESHHGICADDQDRVDAACIALYGEKVMDRGKRGFGLD